VCLFTGPTPWLVIAGRAASTDTLRCGPRMLECLGRAAALLRHWLPRRYVYTAAQGLGSTLHVAAVFLGHALQYERIFLWDPDGQHVGQEYVDPGCGRGELYSNWDCLFEPLSTCAAGNATRSAIFA